MRMFRASAAQLDEVSALPDEPGSDSLTEDLFALGDSSTDDRAADGAGEATGIQPTTEDATVLHRDDIDGADEWTDDFDPRPDEDTYGEVGERRPRRLTWLLVAGLLFVLGALTGVWADRTLAPEPQPRVVYLLSN